jgi:metallo-beta-lactamase family protein
MEPMKIKFMGGARTVTGSCFILETGGHRFAVDCGMHQGNAEIEKRNWDVGIYAPEKIQFFLITHAHIDHSGLLPRMVQQGFRGKIYTTVPTRDLLEIMLLDSAHIQETEALWKSKRRMRHGEKNVKPLYTRKDVEATFPLIETVSYDEALEPLPGVNILFRDAGHILGASLIEIRMEDNGRPMKLVFSGDIGRPAQLLMEDPSVVGSADFLFLESTYGNRNHKDEDESLNELAEAIAYSYKRGEKVIIPAFAVERTQEMMYCLYLLSKDGRLPPDMPVYLDSPMAIRVTEIFRQHTDFLDEETRRLIEKGDDPLRLAQIRFTPTTEESVAINTRPGPAIVISASGMADAGRIKHHLKHNLWREGAGIVFVGFQAQGTTGRKIIDGAQKVRIFNEDVNVKARVYTINGFSAHAGQAQLLAWLSHFEKGAMQVFLVHGEYAAQQALAGLIREQLGYEVFIPDYLEESTLGPGEVLDRVVYPEKAAPRIDWDYLFGEMDARLVQMRDRRATLRDRAWLEQTELRDRLLEINRSLTELISQI